MENESFEDVFLLNMRMFRCYVSLPEGNISYLKMGFSPASSEIPNLEFPSSL